MTAASLAHLYALMRPGEKFAGMVVTVIDGRRIVRLVLVQDGEVRRVVVDEAEAKTGAALCHAALACGLRETARAFVHRLIVSRT